MSDSHNGGGLGFGAMLGAAICAAALAILADLMTPYGPVVLTLGVAFVALALVAGVLSILPPLSGILRPAATFALINALACGAMVGLWYVGPKPAVSEKGVVVTMVPFGAALQPVVVRDFSQVIPTPVAPAATPAAQPAPAARPLTAAEQKQQALLTALAAADPAARLRAGIAALNERDPAVMAGVVDTLYRSPDPAVRQLAVKRMLTQRRGARMPLLATAGNTESQAFANALQGAGLTIRAINETSGTFDGGLCGAAGMTGTVNRNGVTMAARCKTGDGDGTTVLVLTPTDDYQLSGEAHDDRGHTAKVQAQLM